MRHDRALPSRRHARRHGWEDVMGRSVLVAVVWGIACGYVANPASASEISDVFELVEAPRHTAPGRTESTTDGLEGTHATDHLALVGAPLAWARGFDGAGSRVAIIHAGIDGSHPALRGKVIHEVCFSQRGQCRNGSNFEVGPGAAIPCEPTSECSGGTAMASIVAGDGPDYSGVAPGAEIIAVRLGRDTPGGTSPISEPGNLEAALSYLAELHDGLPIATVALSLMRRRDGVVLSYASAAACDAAFPALRAAVEKLREKGIAVVAAAPAVAVAGNLPVPACLSNVTSVGSGDGSLELSDKSAASSFLTLLAPGVEIPVAVPPDRYASVTDSGAAAAQIAGAIAILRQLEPDHSISDLVEVLRGTGTTVSAGEWSLPTLRIDRAVQFLVDVPAGVQISPDERHFLVSKDLGRERWAISYDRTRHTVTGNVFDLDGAAPKFVWCEVLNPVNHDTPRRDETLVLTCAMSDPCGDASCPTSTWTRVGDRLEVPGEFFLPPESTERSREGTVRDASVTGEPSGPSGVQITPDRAHSIVSKALGGQRWLIDLDAAEGSATGNVFDQDGAPPRFLWCGRLDPPAGMEDPAGEIRFECSGADPCTDAACSSSPWQRIGEVSLPTSFFLPP
jgi:hypothetical protein